MTRKERENLEERIGWITARAHGMRDEMFLGLAEVLTDLVKRAEAAEKRLAVLES